MTEMGGIGVETEQNPSRIRVNPSESEWNPSGWGWDRSGIRVNPSGIRANPSGIRLNGSGIVVGSERSRSGVGDENGSGTASEETYSSGVRGNGMQRIRSGGSGVEDQERRIRSGG